MARKLVKNKKGKKMTAAEKTDIESLQTDLNIALTSLVVLHTIINGLKPSTDTLLGFVEPAAQIFYDHLSGLNPEMEESELRGKCQSMAKETITMLILPIASEVPVRAS
jgi:hypothetical protein